MKNRHLLLAAIVVLAAGAWTTTRAGEPVRGARLDAVVAVAPGGVAGWGPSRPAWTAAARTA